MSALRSPPKGSKDRDRVPSGPRPKPGNRISSAIYSKLHQRVPADNFLPQSREDLNGYDHNDIKPGYLISPVDELTASPEHSPPSEPSSLPGSPPPLDLGNATKTPSFPAPVKSRSKPNPLRLNTLNLNPSATASPKKQLSPSLEHWQQVRDHVLSTPAVERAAQSAARTPKKHGLVSKAAGKFGFRQAADQVIGGNERRQSTMAMMAQFGQLSVEEREEIARERRKFARDIKTCLDACSLEESKRRLAREAHQKFARTSASATVSDSQSHVQRFNFDPDFSPFAPLLTELHKYLPAARARKPWSRTCPHHGAILAELSTAFLEGSTSPEGERQQALEVFGAIVKNWSADTPEEELSRWLWLCRALVWDDKQLRKRGVPLLVSFLRNDPALPESVRPDSAAGFISLAGALLKLVYALEKSSYHHSEHQKIVTGLLGELNAGLVLSLDDFEDVFPNAVMTGTPGGDEPELLWMAAAVVIGDDIGFARWLLSEGSSNLKRFQPPPILHATPPAVLQLRLRSIDRFLVGFLRLVEGNNVETISLVWSAVKDLLLPELSEVAGQDYITPSLAKLLLHLEVLNHTSGGAVQSADDPFRISTIPPQRQHIEHRDLIIGFLAKDKSKANLVHAAKGISHNINLIVLSRLIKYFLSVTALIPLGHQCLTGLFDRLCHLESSQEVLSPFLGHLQTSSPQLLYKSLFACAAASLGPSLLPHLQLVRAIASTMGASRFWTYADPQMVAILLLGDTAPKESKGKAKQGETDYVNVKLGRYVVLVEFISALSDVRESATSGSRLRLFIDAIETRIAALIEIEEKESRFPNIYRGLICRLLLRLRELTGSLRKAAWLRFVLRWAQEIGSHARRHSATPFRLEETLGTLYSSLEPTPIASAGPTPQSTKRSTTGLGPKRQATIPPAANKSHFDFGVDPDSAVLQLVVLMQASLKSEDWSALLPHVWSRADGTAETKAIPFLLMKCAEVAPSSVRAIILKDLSNTDLQIRQNASIKLTTLFGARYQILSQKFLTDRRGPVFNFASRPVEHVATEIGSSTWVATHDVQDAALQKFGKTLPIELRQRLMELGWNEDETDSHRSDREQIPLTMLPALHGQQDESSADRSPAQSPSLVRRSSTGSSTSIPAKKRKPVFAPVIYSAITEYTIAIASASTTDILSTSINRETRGLLQRDDALMCTRIISENLSTDLSSTLVSLVAARTTLTPGFAYLALNALVGYLKGIFRQDAQFAQYPQVLTTISILIPAVSGISLRDIRKNKAEHILLPASIHEEGGGYKLHAPWQDNSIDIQTTQLLILRDILKVNPREVYLVKKMLSNLQISSSIHNLSFARAWLVLIVQLFSTLNKNYTDRAELRHFLTNVAGILRQHCSDLLVVTQAMRTFILCSARFRRLYASVGVSTTISAIYETYRSGHSAIRDCVEYSMRSFYRIHAESFVYQVCVTLSEDVRDPEAVYNMLCSLSLGNSTLSGVASGLKGLNDREEVEALVQMISGPELAISEIGQAAADRQAKKMASVTLEDNIFPKENIVKLFITIIASAPATRSDVVRLFASIVPSIKDDSSRMLLKEGIDALGLIFSQTVGVEGSRIAWDEARQGYLLLVSAYARSGGDLNPPCVKRVFAIAFYLLRKRGAAIGPIISVILAKLSPTHLSFGRPAAFLRDVATLYRSFLLLIDFAPVLEAITALIKKSQFDLDHDLTQAITVSYVEPTIRTLSTERGMALNEAFRSAFLDLLSAIVICPDDAFMPIDRQTPNSTLLATVLLPMALSIQSPSSVDREQELSRFWVRLLNYVSQVTSRNRHTFVLTSSSRQSAALVFLCFQIIKIISIRAKDTISSVKGLWNFIARMLLDLIEDGDILSGSSMNSGSIRLVDWMMWSIYELLSLHRLPHLIEFRPHIQIGLSKLKHEDTRSRPSSPGLNPRKASISPSVFAGRARLASRSHSTAFTTGFSPRQASTSYRLSPSPSVGSSPTQNTHSQAPSPGRLSPLLGQGRFPSSSGRPSFMDLSKRRASRPVLPSFPSDSSNQSPGVRYRFPSAVPVQAFNSGEKGGGAIVHLLGAPNAVSSAVGAGSSPTQPQAQDHSRANWQVAKSIRETKIESDLLKMTLRRSVKVIQMVFGYEVELEEDEEEVKPWSAHDALLVISDQTRLFIETEFSDMFLPQLEHQSTQMPGKDDDHINEDIDHHSESTHDQHGVIEAKYTEDTNSIAWPEPTFGRDTYNNPFGAIGEHEEEYSDKDDHAIMGRAISKDKNQRYEFDNDQRELEREVRVPMLSVSRPSYSQI